ncbi:hypothetical protein [Paraclostridium dentum]
MDSIFNLINKSFKRRKDFGKEVRSAIKFLINCILLLPIEVIDCFKSKNQ